MSTRSDDGCIRYLMKEMDPSEELEFEKMMREDEDLLIEVESLRATYRKLEKLPLKNPPESLADNVREEARRIQQERLQSNRYFLGYFGKMVAAATLLIAAVTATFHILEKPATGSSQPAVNEASSALVEPWVDRDQVIRYRDITTQSSAIGMEGEMTNSLKKLKLVESPQLLQDRNSGIQLTRSTN